MNESFPTGTEVEFVFIWNDTISKHVVRQRLGSVQYTDKHFSLYS